MWYTSPTHVLLILLWLAAAPAAVGHRSAHAQDTTQPAAVEFADSPSLLVAVTDTVDADALRELAAAHELTVVRFWPPFRLAELALNESVLQAGASSLTWQHAALAARQAALVELPQVRHVSLDVAIEAAGVGRAQPSLPSDPLAADQWGLSVIGAPEGWTITEGNSTTTVALIDSGLDIEHEEFHSGTLWVNPAEESGIPGKDDDENGFVDDYHGWDWIDDDGAINDAFGHGTHVGGTIAAANNETGIAGLARAVRILPLRVLDKRGRGRLSDLIDAIHYAVEQEVDVINLSLVLQFEAPALGDVIRAAHARDIILVAAAGNASLHVLWPAAYAETVAVVATDRNDLAAEFNNHGPEVDLAAPGVDIISTFPSNRYRRISGTSVATAHVSALAALVRSLRPDMDQADLLALLRRTASDINGEDFPGYDEHTGSGRIDFGAALHDASTGLNLQTGDVKQQVFPEQAVVYPIQVTTSVGDRPVAGAVVYYDLVRLGEETDPQSVIELSGRMLTDAEGVADVTFTAPAAPGELELRARVGDATHEIPLRVLPPPAALHVTGPLTTTVAERHGDKLHITILDDEGEPYPGDVPVHVHASGGTFANSQKQLEMVVENSILNVRFFPPETSGHVNIGVEVGHLRRYHGIEIVPGPAAYVTLHVPATISSEQNGVQLPIRIEAGDAYDNPVRDGQRILLSSDAGTLTSAEPATQHGAATAILQIPAEYQGQIRVQAAIPGTSIRDAAEIAVLQPVVWLSYITHQ